VPRCTNEGAVTLRGVQMHSLIDTLPVCFPDWLDALSIH
jgi:hypothetical protein